jgi:hypothetical protein
MSTNEINLQLRTNVLEMALWLERSITDLIKLYFSVSKPKLKALSHKSGNLSFKNKIDLLNDFEILADEEYKALIHLMEFRNQFMHNIECNSFTKAVEILGSDRGKYLLAMLRHESKLDTEQLYLNAYRHCYFYAVDFLHNKSVTYLANFRFKKDFLISHLKETDFLKRSFWQTLYNVIEFAENYLKLQNVEQSIIKGVTVGMVNVAKETKVDGADTEFVPVNLEAIKILFDLKPSWQAKEPFPTHPPHNANEK